MRFTHFLLAALALTTAPSLSSATGFHGSVAFSSPSRSCDGPGTCTSCVGLSNCCNDEKNPDYGRCGRGGSRAYNCPDGSKFTCNGGNCPDELVCNFEADQCDAKAHFCWGTITCSGSACPAGYSVGDFCYQDGASAQFKVCGTTTPTTTQPPATQPPATQPPATTAPPIGENPTQPPETTTAPPTTPTGPAIPQPGEEPTPADVVCYQEIIGSLTGTYAQVKAALDVWAQLLHTTLGLTGAVELSIGYAQVPDRNSFENGCNGPYDTVADVFVHIQTTGGAEYDRISAALEAFIAANPLTGLPGISCSARSVVTNLPTCGKLPTPTGPAVPQPGEDSVVCYQEIVGSLEGTYDDIKAMFDDWALRAYTTLGLTGPIDVHINFAQVPDRNSFENGCNGPYATVADLFVHISTQNYDGVSAALEAFIAANPLTAYPAITCSARSVTAYIPICGRAPTPAPTLPPLPAIPQPEVPTPANVVCYQEIIGSLTGTYAEVKAALDGWAQLLYTTLGLSGHIGLSINYAQVPDRDSFENGCNGPYATVADVFVHIQTSGNADYDRISAALEAFIAANPLTGLSVISCSARSVVTYLPRCGKLPSTPTAPALPQPGDDSVVCYQEIVGSLTGSYAQVSAAFDDWALRAYTALGLTGPIDVHINYAQVTDRNSFENGCNGPYATVADLFVHISTQNYAAVSAALEAFIAANPLTAYPVISCSARSVTANIPICGPAPTLPPALPPANNPTQAPATTAPTTPNLPNLPGANPGGEVPTPANVVCYQEVVGSLTGTYAQISAALDLWEQQMYLALGLTGPIELVVGHAQIPDRQSFENGCNGPYNAMADLFVHIQTTQANYDAVSAALEAFIAANPLTGLSGISCSARSVVTYLPTCGKIPTAPALPQPSDAAVLCYQEVVGSLTGTYAQVSAALDAWQLLMYTSLGLTGPIELTVGHAQIPDRISFENGCNGPYATMADLFIHIPTTFGAYDALSAQLEAFIAANPFTGLNTISCSARSNVAELPSCGKIPNPPVDVPNVPAPNLPQPPQTQTCPVVGFVPSVVEAGMIEGGKKIYKIVYDITTPDEIISFIDVHITTSLGFFNYRMSLAATATPMQPSYELTFPMYLALGAGESFTYWFTTASTSAANPREIACDSASFSFTTPGTPNPVPVVPVTPPAACPSVAFDYAIERVGAGEVLNTGVYAITFASATPATTVAWVDVHIHANGGFFNYRMEVDGSGFKQILPSPHLNLATGATVEYWFTYEAGGVTCDTATYSVVV